MKDFLELVKEPFLIKKIVIYNFTVIDEEIEIEIEIYSDTNGAKKILFEKVTNLNIDASYYRCSDNSLIILEDLTTTQMEGIKYKIAISEDAMAFYCWHIIVI